MKKFFKAIVDTTGNVIFLAIVAFVVLFAIYFSRRNVVNDANRIYMNYTNIVQIRTDYAQSEMHVIFAGDTMLEPTKECIYKLDDINESDIILIDNSVTCPTPIDKVLHIPDTYN